MTQYAKPISTKNNGGAWAGNISGASLHLDIDEGVASTDDFTSYAAASSQPNNADTAPVVVKITSVTTPSDGTCDFRVRTYASENTTYTHELRQGYVNESSKGTLLATMSQTHTGGGVWQTKEDASCSFSGCTDGSDIYYRCIGHNNSGSFETVAITAMDVDLPNADTTRNLSGTPDILATTPITGSGTLKCSWSLTNGTPNLTAPTGDGTIVVTQGSHTLTDGAPNLTAPAGTGTLLCRWVLTGSAVLTPLTGTGTGGLGPAYFSGAVDLLPYFIARGLAIKFVSEKCGTWDVAVSRARDIIDSGKRILFSVAPFGSEGILLTHYTEFEGQTKQQIQALCKPAFDALMALQPDESQSPNSNFDTGNLAYTPEPSIQVPECPAADPVNARGDRTVRVSPTSRELKVIRG